MNYKDEMRKLIDIVKQQSLNTSLAQTLDDMNILTSAAGDLRNRLSIRFRNTTQPEANLAQEKCKVQSNTSSKVSPFIPLLPILQSTHQVCVNPFQAINQKVCQQSKVR